MSTVQGTATQLPGACQQRETGPGAQRRGPGTDGESSITVSGVGALVQRGWLSAASPRNRARDRHSRGDRGEHSRSGGDDMGREETRRRKPATYKPRNP